VPDVRQHPVAGGLRGEWVFRDIKTPFDGATVYLNRWWLMKGGKGVFYAPSLRTDPRSYSPQCNTQESIVRGMKERKTWSEFDIEFVEVAYVPRREY
jgi:hypothetical protein